MAGWKRRADQAWLFCSLHFLSSTLSATIINSIFHPIKLYKQQKCKKFMNKGQKCTVYSVHLITGRGDTDRDTVSDWWSISVTAHILFHCDNQRQSRFKCSSNLKGLNWRGVPTQWHNPKRKKVFVWNRFSKNIKQHLPSYSRALWYFAQEINKLLLINKK